MSSRRIKREDTTTTNDPASASSSGDAGTQLLLPDLQAASHLDFDCYLWIMTPSIFNN